MSSTSTHYALRFEHTCLGFTCTADEASAILNVFRTTGVRESQIGYEELPGPFPIDEATAAAEYEREIEGMILDESVDGEDPRRTESIDLDDEEDDRVTLYLERADVVHMTRALLRRDQLPPGFAQRGLDDEVTALELRISDALAIEAVLRGVAISSDLRDQFAKIRRSTFRLI